MHDCNRCRNVRIAFWMKAWVSSSQMVLSACFSWSISVGFGLRLFIAPTCLPRFSNRVGLSPDCLAATRPSLWNLERVSAGSPVSVVLHVLAPHPSAKWNYCPAGLCNLSAIQEADSSSSSQCWCWLFQQRGRDVFLSNFHWKSWVDVLKHEKLSWIRSHSKEIWQKCVKLVPVCA